MPQRHPPSPNVEPARESSLPRDVTTPLAPRRSPRRASQAVYMTGNGLSASLLGAPDIGLLTMTEMVARARAIAAALDSADRRRRHGLRQREQRRPHDRRIRGGGRCRGPPRRPGHAEEMRRHGRYGADLEGGACREDRRRGARANPPRLPDHRSLRCAPAPRARRSDRPRPRLRGRRRGSRAARDAAIGGRDARGASQDRRAADVQLRREEESRR